MDDQPSAFVTTLDCVNGFSTIGIANRAFNVGCIVADGNNLSIRIRTARVGR